MYSAILRTHPGDEEICKLDTSYTFARRDVVHVHFSKSDVRTYQVIETHVDVMAGGGLIAPVTVYLSPVDATAHTCDGKHTEIHVPSAIPPTPAPKKK